MFKIIISILALIALILLIWALIEPHRPEFTRINMNDTAKPGLRVLFFTDLHKELCYVRPGYITSLISEHRPDCVIFGGDIATDPNCREDGIAYLKEISECCRGLDIPFYGVPGNHDKDMTIPMFERTGAVSLVDRYEVIGEFVLSGVRDSGREDRVWYEPVSIPEAVTAGRKHIWFVHDPDAILHIENKDKVDYMLSGHFHGGQIRTPFRLEFIIRKDELPHQWIIQGKHRIGNTTLFISRGVGCAWLPLRLLVRPEISLIEF
ncbi:MAG: metallophosphoesterase [Clostridiales bacterium]|nr:metallophosphoesterase [Clostridiales bacterium]